MNPSEKKKLLDEVLGAEEAASGSELPEFLTQAIRQRRRRRIRQRVAAVMGVSLAIVGLGFVAFHRTHSVGGMPNKSIAKAGIHEAVTTAPKVRTRKFQAEVVKTKDHKPLPKVVPHNLPAVEMVSTQSAVTGPTSESSVASAFLQIIDARPTDISLADDQDMGADRLNYVTTTRGGYHVLNDDDLLATLAPSAVMLTRDATGEEHVFFLNSKENPSG